MALATATITALGLIGAAGAAGGATIYSANRQSGAATDAARLTTDATTHAADLQSQTADKTQAFLRQQAENDWRNTEATRQANYNLSRSRQAAAQTLGHSIGFNLPDLPDYVPTTDPHFDAEGGPLPSSSTTPTSGPTPPGGAPSGLPTVDPAHGDLAGQISAYFRSRGVSDQETPYWVGKWSELTARGQQLGNPNYANQRLSQADIFGGNRGTAPPAAPAPSSALTVGTLGQSIGAPVRMADDASAPQLTAPPQLLDNPYRPGTIGFALRRRA